MSALTDPVEKVVETLFFHLVFQANPARPFVYASLSGNAEKRFGDALAYVGTVFVFEFKRSLASVSDELEKFKGISARDEGEFNSGLDLCVELLKNNPDTDTDQIVSLLLNPPTGHYLVAFPPKLFGKHLNNCLIGSASDSENLDIRPYLNRLRAKSCGSITADQRYGVVGLVKTSGMALEVAIAYFQLILKLKTGSGGSGELSEADTLFACFAVDENGRVGISSCTGLQHLSQLFEEIRKKNQRIRPDIEPDTPPQARNTEKDRDDYAPRM